MPTNYVPILKAKLGELQALAESKKIHSRKLLPMFEVCRIGDGTRKAARFRDSTALTCDYLDETAARIASVRGGKRALFDAFQWPANSETETGEHIVPYLHSRLVALGVKAVPVIGYDRWDSHEYRMALQGIELGPLDFYCLRLDSHAIDDSDDAPYFEERLLEILNDMDLEPSRCAALIDFGDVTGASLEHLVNKATQMLLVLAPLGFKFIATAGCSLPPSIDLAVGKPDTNGKVVRKEMLLWQTMRAEFPKLRWKFSDYGVRGPNSAEDIISPHTNGKIRHTIDQKYFVVRGHSVQLPGKGAQMYKLAETVVASPYFMGEGFSWGDARILACSREEFKGNATDWIAIDTSHHLAWVTEEVEEFEMKVAAALAEQQH